jgi:hypothetical protein
MATYDVAHEGKKYTPDGRLAEQIEEPKHTHCADCGELLPTPKPGDFSAGSAVLTDENNREIARVCYHCAHVREYDHAKRTGELFAYLTRKPIKVDTTNGRGEPITCTRNAWLVTSWPGETFAKVHMGKPYRSNFGDTRYPFTFKLGKEQWYGIGYGGEGMYARCRRSRAKK